MKFQKSKLLQLNSDLMKKSKGNIEWVFGLFLILFMFVFISFELQLLKYKAASDSLEDSLAASGLAAALIDIEKYSQEKIVNISDDVDVYDIYKKTLAVNLGMESVNNLIAISSYSGDYPGTVITREELPFGYEEAINSLIYGPVLIEKFYIYNVTDNIVETIIIDDYGARSAGTGTLGTVSAPNGVLIENTGIYGEISFYVEGLFGLFSRAHKGKLIEIKRSEIGR